VHRYKIHQSPVILSGDRPYKQGFMVSGTPRKGNGPTTGSGRRYSHSLPKACSSGRSGSSIGPGAGGLRVGTPGLEVSAASLTVPRDQKKACPSG
jgi:hypothetical protein